jgi:zinc and cadmium transporter
MSPIILSLFAVLVISLISLIGLFTLSFKEGFLRKVLFLLISLAAGALLGDAFIHLLPEAFAEAGSTATSIFVLAGILSFLMLEKFLHWHHTHGDESSDGHARVHPLGRLVIVSDSVHNLVDGIAIGAAFLVSPEIGIATTIAIALHEIPQEIGDFGLLLHAGYSRARALFVNFLSALTAFVGVGIAFWLADTSEALIPLIAAFAAGNFIYIALADLVPELHKTVGGKRSIAQFLVILAGLAVMVGLAQGEGHAHGHEEEHHEETEHAGETLEDHLHEEEHLPE